jgi:hypothetical protein
MIIGFLTYLMIGSLLTIFTQGSIKKDLERILPAWYKEYTEDQRFIESKDKFSYETFVKLLSAMVFFLVTFFWPYFVYLLVKGIFKK